MRQITLNEFFNRVEALRGLSLAVIVNAYELDTVYCIDEFDYKIFHEDRGEILRFFSKNGLKSYYDYHGIFISLSDVDKISLTEDTLYIYLQNQLVKIRYK